MYVFAITKYVKYDDKLDEINIFSLFQFQEERLACAALSLVPLEKCIQATIDYTRQRQAFGKPLLDNQVK